MSQKVSPAHASNDSRQAAEQGAIALADAARFVQRARRIEAQFERLAGIALRANRQESPERPPGDSVRAEGSWLQRWRQWALLGFRQQAWRNPQEQLPATLQQRVHEAGVADIGNACRRTWLLPRAGRRCMVANRRTELEVQDREADWAPRPCERSLAP